ncbi:hypothetical protein CWE12_06445 [Aliidiomarina sedimenti]|uniref:Tetratricopeptide repeat protein n=1 Tax=Aliidiomarina sedimenti TaxID=1933879 RepID=A0ABY0C0L4_9GAMM|nr:hypothetical protein [Aliidiomarina sedimenti]RUO30872.1 hypothetical protein CWE12_06445 [Aliidiomarina sedimenti]
MINFLMFVAVIAVVAIVARSIVVKRQVNNSEPVTHSAEKTAAETTRTEQTDSTAIEASATGEAEAQQATVKAAEKAHIEKAGEATKSDLERAAGAGVATNSAPPVPGEVEPQAAGLAETTDPLARHRLYQQIVDTCYRERDTEQGRIALMHYAQAHLDEFEHIRERLAQVNGGKLPQVSTFKHYASVLGERGQYAEAISVCEQALDYGLKDGTKTGYQGRIERLKAKQEKD